MAPLISTDLPAYDDFSKAVLKATTVYYQQAWAVSLQVAFTLMRDGNSNAKDKRNLYPKQTF